MLSVNDDGHASATAERVEVLIPFGRPVNEEVNALV